MELDKVIHERRSVRKYTDKKVDKEVLEKIIDAALWAPSGVNLQPWYFVVISNEKEMEEYRKVMAEVAQKNKAHLESRFSAHPEVVTSTMNFVSNLGGAPVAILIFEDKPDYSWALHHDGIVQSIAAAVENMLLCAYDNGLSSCWLTAPVEARKGDELRDKYAPGHGELLSMVCLGYANEEDIPKAPKRKENKYVIL